jgi:microcin C transport system substrate-binding protein
MTSRLRSRVWITFVVGLCCLSFVSTGCKRRTQNAGANLNIKNTWHKIDTPPGADPSVPDTLGGNGFEKVAEQMGFVTYTPTEEDIKLFTDPNAKTGGQITFTETAFPATFRPEGQGSSLAQIFDIKAMVYEALVGQHPITLETAPALASHWKISADKKTFTFRIDPRARFSDGSPVVAEDVVATWKLMTDPSLLEPSAALVYGKFEQPVAKSKYIVEVQAKTVNFRNLLYFGSSMLIFSSKEIGNLTGTEFLEKFNTNMPLGTGEYIVLASDIKSGQSYALTRRDDYWAKDDVLNKSSGNFDKINYLVVKDNPGLEYEKFKAGETDVFRFTMSTTEKWVNDTKYDAIANGYVQRRRIFTDGPMGTQGITFNMRKPPFDDIRIRKAVMMCFPRQQMIEKLLYNEYEAYDTYYPNSIFANPTNTPMKYDPEMAQKLLAEAGWKTRNSDGILMKNGKPFVIDLPIQKPLERFLTPYQQELRKVGIDLRLKFMDWNAIIENIDERNFSVFAFGYTGLVTPNPETSLKSTLADKNDNNNIQGFKNARVDELLDAYDSTFSIQGQRDIVREIDGIAYNTYMSGFWWNPKGIRVAHWNKFGMPAYGLPKTGQLSYAYRTIAGSWWYDADKVAALEEARKNKKPLDGPKDVIEMKFWKEYKK